MDKVVLSISLLVSNRIDTIRKCMESLKPIMEAIPAELIAIDTGCTDGSIEVVSEYTDKIYKFKWIKDFAAARNEGLKRAAGEWFMFIDDDEWFEDASEIIEFFKSGEYERYGTADYKVRNYTVPDGSRYGDTFAGRMSRLTKELHFEGRVHEVLVPLYLPRKQLGSYCHHYGYAFANEEKRKEHGARNIELLEKEIKDNQLNIRAIVHLIQEFSTLSEWDKVSDMCGQILDSLSGDWKHPEIQYVIVFKARNYNNAGRHKEALEYIKDIEGKYPLTERSRLLLAAEAVVAASACAERANVLEYADRFFLLMDAYHKEPERFHKDFVMDDVSYVSERLQLKITLLAFKNAALIDDAKSTEKYFEKMACEEEALIETLEAMFISSSTISYALKYADVESFTLIIKHILEKHAPKDISEYVLSQKDAFTDYPEMYELARMVLSEEQVLRYVDTAKDAEIKYDELNDLLYKYTDAVCEYTTLMYKEDFLNVPDNCRFALYFIRSEEERMAGRVKESLALKKEAAKAYPVMLQAIQTLIQAYANIL